MYADLLLVNGRILTLRGRSFRALSVKNGRVEAVGTSKELQSRYEPFTPTIHLRGRLAVPGFTDSHVHLAALAASRREVDLKSAASLEKALEAVAARARHTAPGMWITGGRFDKNRWGDAFPTRHDLDRVAPEHPVALSSRDGHALWVNSRALRACSITAKTPAPPGGEIVRDHRGQASGILLEGATALVYGSPAFSRPAADEDALRAALRYLARRGITSIHAMDGIPILLQLQKLREAGRLDQRITIYPPFSALDDLVAAGLRSGFGDEWIRIGGLKLFVDGALGSQTAWLFEPYENVHPESAGIPVVSERELRESVRRAAEAGFACAIHAIGDRANAAALSAIEAAQDCPTRLPHRIEHAQLVRPEDIPRFRRAGVVASMQPCHILGDIGAAERYWGERSRYAYPIRSLLRAGTTLAFGSDTPVETDDPLAGIYAAVCRQDPDGNPPEGWYRKEEGIRRVGDALRAYASGPAAATGEADCKGVLEPGNRCLADIVVLSHDITKLDGRSLLEARVDMTIVGGRVCYQRRGAW
jgi:predicted amidohydrolase YtcJ